MGEERTFNFPAVTVIMETFLDAYLRGGNWFGCWLEQSGASLMNKTCPVIAVMQPTRTYM